jgi:hypothetical protein
LEHLKLTNGFVAVLIGMTAPSVPETMKLPLVDATMLGVKVLHPDEYEYAGSLGDDGAPNWPDGSQNEETTISTCWTGPPSWCSPTGAGQARTG